MPSTHSKRRPISAKTKVDVAILQAQLSRPMHGVTCPLCREELGFADARVLEHMTPHALTSDDSAENLRWVHKRCADLKTRGCEGTSKKGSVANGDTHKIAKAARIAEGGRKVRHPMPPIPESIKEAKRKRDRELRARIKAERRAT